MLAEHLPSLREEHGAELCIVNGENAAGGFGITEENAEELFSAGADVLTSGNHIWNRKETAEFLSRAPRLLRPANYPRGAPGRGIFVEDGPAGRFAVINLMGRVFMSPLESPFRESERLLGELDEDVRVILVDFHAEATSEKVALGWHLDGKVSAVIGTHTHIQTADERILPGGTAYITDAGMTGPADSVIGIKREIVLEKFLSNLPRRMEAAAGPETLQGLEEALDAVQEAVRGGVEARFAYAAGLASTFSGNREAGRHDLALWLAWWRDVMIVKHGTAGLVTHRSAIASFESVAGALSSSQVVAAIQAVRQGIDHLERNVNPRLALEYMMLAMPRP